jgi:hypothetical protein
MVLYSTKVCLKEIRFSCNKFIKILLNEMLIKILSYPEFEIRKLVLFKFTQTLNSIQSNLTQVCNGFYFLSLVDFLKTK